MTAASFGQHLLERGIVSPHDLEQATEAILLFGGRLGTHLVQAGAIAIGEMERHLSDHLGVSLPPERGIGRPEPAALNAVPPELVERYRLLPFQREGATLHVAMADPWDPDQAEALLRATGLCIRPYVLSELRLAFLLEKHCGIARASGGTGLGDAPRPEGRAQGGGPEAVGEAPAGGEPAALARRELGILPLDPGEELIHARDFETLYANTLGARHHGVGAASSRPSREPRREACPGSESPPRPASELSAEPSAACEVDWVVRAVLRIARVHARAVALFVVRDAIEGLRAAGDIVREDLRDLRLPLRPDHLFGRAALEGRPARGSLEGVDLELVRALGAGEVGEGVVLPIRIRERVVNLLYADAGLCPISEEVLSLLDVLCERVAEAYVRIIRDRRRPHP